MSNKKDHQCLFRKGISLLPRFVGNTKMLISFIFQMKLIFRDFSDSNNVPFMVEFPKVSGMEEMVFNNPTNLNSMFTKYQIPLHLGAVQ